MIFAPLYGLYCRGMRKLPKQIKLKPSTRKDKKWMVVFGFEKPFTVHFGAKGYSDYTIHNNDDIKRRYIARHKVNENWNDPYTAGTLSRWILWNKKSIRASFQDYKERFG